MTKKFILTADEFGLTKALNQGIIEGCSGELLKTVSVVANGEYFISGTDELLAAYPHIGIGVQLNLTLGKALCSDLGILIDENGNFKNSFYKLLVNIYNPKEKDLLANIEREFRRQIELVLSKTKVSYICSVDNVHNIPKVFELVCKLAKEYNIQYIRSNYEKLYIIPDILRHCNRIYFKNIFQTLILNILTIFNEVTVNSYGLKTNDYFIGGIYNNIFNALAVSYGISTVKYDNIIVECSIKPCRYEEGIIDYHFQELLITKNKKLKEKIIKLGFEITNYVEKES